MYQEWVLLPVVCAVYVCVHVYGGVLLSSHSPGLLEGLGQRISTSVRNLGQLPRGESPTAALRLKTVMIFLVRPGGGTLVG